MSYSVLVTIIGQIADESEAANLADALERGVAQANKYSCIVDIWDARLGRYLRHKVIHPLPDDVH